MATVTRTYQLGGSSVFPASSRKDLLQRIAADRLGQHRGGDTQGIRYSVATIEDARSLGCYETNDGAWIVDGSQTVIHIDPNVASSKPGGVSALQELEKTVNDVQEKLGSEDMLPCRERKRHGGKSCLSEEWGNDNEGRNRFWFGSDCHLPAEKFCEPCLAYWHIAVTRNILIAELAKRGLRPGSAVGG